MLDIKLIRKDPDECEARLKRKEQNISLSEIITLDAEVRALKAQTESLTAKKKNLSQQFHIKKNDTAACESLTVEINSLSNQIEEFSKDLTNKELLLIDKMSHLPNYPFEDIPVSMDKNDNQVIKTYGNKPEFSFSPLHHLELNQKLKLFDFTNTAKTTGSGWPAYRGFGAELEWALISFMKDKQIEHGFEFWLPPLLVKKDILFGSGQIPKFNGQYYEVLDGNHSLYLIPTAEVVLNGMHSNEVLPELSLPIKYAAYTPCFRREAGAAGSNERGLVRVHQFNKVEMFAFSTPENSDAVFNDFITVAEDILVNLGLHYQLSLLVTGDMSFTAAKTIDVEVWLPGQNRYYEVSSISNCTDYQARRSNIKYKTKTGALDFVHTLNGSGLATPRLLTAILENNQQQDGSVLIPNVLRKYLNNKEYILPT